MAEARRQEELELLARPAPTPSPVRVEELQLEGAEGPLRARLYRPPSAVARSPAFVYFYGGGWVLGSLDVAEPVCRALAERTPCAVVAASYRRAPEHRFPAAAEDAYAVVLSLARRAPELGLDPSRLAVGGASAGGNLAAVAAQLARDRGGPSLVLQVLVYPVTDHLASGGSLLADADPDFGAADVAWCWDHYLSVPADGADPRASPLRAPDLGGLASALVLTAEADPLRDQGEAYADSLAAAGVRVEAVRCEGVRHGFFSKSGPAADEAQARVAAALRDAFALER